MRRIALWLLSTVTALVLVFGFDASWRQVAGAADTVAESSASSSGSSGSSSSSGSSGSPGSSGSSGSASPSATASPTTAATRTVTGPAVQTRWGPVQVELTVEGDQIVDVVVVQYPDGNHHDQEINAYALPVLVDETLTAQSAGIDMVSGATVTSQGYVQSLQAALDEAGL